MHACWHHRIKLSQGNGIDIWAFCDYMNMPEQHLRNQSFRPASSTGHAVSASIQKAEHSRTHDGQSREGCSVFGFIGTGFKEQHCGCRCCSCGPRGRFFSCCFMPIGRCLDNFSKKETTTARRRALQHVFSSLIVVRHVVPKGCVSRGTESLGKLFGKAKQRHVTTIFDIRQLDKLFCIVFGKGPPKFIPAYFASGVTCL